MASSERVDVEVLFEYDAEEDDELTIKPGDIITDVEQGDGGWWTGTIRGKRGVFPDNFVKVIEKTQTKTTRKPPALPTQSIDKPAEVPLIPEAKKPEPKRTGIKAKVVYPYTPTASDELELVMGDIIDIIDKSDENWWEGELEGKKGVFPSNFVELVEESKEIKPKKIVGVGFGNIFAGGGAPKLRPTTRPAPNNVPPSEPKVAAPTSIVPPVLKPTTRDFGPPKLPAEKQKSPVETARVLYNYEAQNDDELSLSEGAIVVVLDKNLDDAGWWKGEVNGRVGVFPDNFVQLLSPPEESQNKASTRPPPPTSLPPDVHPPAADEPKAPAKGRKPPGPPPVGKKPAKVVENSAHTDEHDDHTPLPSHTKDRVKPPNSRKPPSKKSPSLDLPEADDPVKPIPAIPPPTTQHDGGVAGQRKSMKFPTGSLDHPSTTAPPTKTDDSAHAQEIAKLRKELDILKSKSVFKEDYDHLKAELNAVKAQMTEQREKFNKEMKIFMEDIDEVKKERANMKVELDRVKKLVALSH